MKTRRDFDALRPRTPPRRYLAGETHWFLGREYRLRIDLAAPAGARLTGTLLLVGGADPDEPSRVRNRVRNWYQREGRRIMSDRLEAALETFPWSGHRPRLIVRPMEKRWGSLTAGGKSLLLNRRLAEVDIGTIDYVIIHELCHLLHANHGADFVVLLNDRMPDWQSRKARLEKQTR